LCLTLVYANYVKRTVVQHIEILLYVLTPFDSNNIPLVNFYYILYTEAMREHITHLSAVFRPPAHKGYTLRSIRTEQDSSSCVFHFINYRLKRGGVYGKV